MSNEPTPPVRPFRATLRQTYALADRQLLILEQYEGDVGPGDTLVLTVGETSVDVRVRDLAWGSAFKADEPPLTLIIDPIEGEQPEGGASLASK